MSFQSIDPTAQIAEDVQIYDFVYVGRNTIIGKGTKVGNLVHIDHDVVIGERCKIQGSAYICSGTHIGNNVFIGPNVSFTNDNYPSANRNYNQIILNGVTVQDDAVIGAGAVLGPGIQIGLAAVVGMGSIVTKNVGPFEIVVGNPAHYFGSRVDYNNNQKRWSLN